MEISKKRRLVIGDVHGCYNTLYELLFGILKVDKEDEIYFLGDLIDRGPGIKKTLDMLLDMIDEGYHVISILGNHEWMLLKSINSIEIFAQWLLNNGDTTLKSFNVKEPHDVPEKYIDFISKMPYYIKLDDFVLVHAGLNFEFDDPFNDRESMLWIRESPIDLRKTGNRRLITGHTPVRLERVKESLNEDKIMLDGGCIYKNIKPGQGYLCCLELNSLELFVQENIDF